MSIAVQGLPSSHSSPSLKLLKQPSALSHWSIVQGSVSAHGLGSPVQAPPEQMSLMVQNWLSLQGAELGEP